MLGESFDLKQVRNPRLGTQTRTSLVTFVILLLSSLFITLYMVGALLLAVTMGGILSILCHPIYEWLLKHFKPRLAAFITTLGLVLLVIVPSAVLVNMAIKQGVLMGRTIVSDGSISFGLISDWLGKLGLSEKWVGSPAELGAQIQKWIREIAQSTTRMILEFAAFVPKILMQSALASVACYFFLIDGKNFISWTTLRIPLESDVRRKVIKAFQSASVSVVLAAGVAGLAQSLFMLIAFLILGVPAAVLAGGATFVFSWIPIVGSSPIWISGAIYLFINGMTVKGTVMILLGLLSGVVDNFIRPLVLKGRGMMHPLVSLVAIIGGVGIFGIVGVFVGPILVSVLIAFLQIWPLVGLRFGLLPLQSTEERMPTEH